MSWNDGVARAGGGGVLGVTHPAVARCNQLLREQPDAIEELATAAAELHEARVNFDTESPLSDAEYLVEVLLRLSAHPSPAVRTAATVGMSTHPLPALGRRLGDMAARDPDLMVRAAAEKAGEQMWRGPLLCIQCNYDEARLCPPQTGDPEDTSFLWPMFCDTNCAVEFAFDAAREEFRGGVRHVCWIRGGWQSGSAADCTDCETAALLGCDVEIEEPQAPEPTKPAKRRSRMAAR